MKKAKVVLSVVLAIIALIAASVIYVSAVTENGTEGYYTFTKFNNKVTITDVDSSISGEVVVPSTISDGEVNEIGENAFKDCNLITSITVPNSVTSIGAGAFKGMSALEEITLPFIGANRDATGYEAVLGYVFGYVLDSNATPTSGTGFTTLKFNDFPDAVWQYSYYSGPYFRPVDDPDRYYYPVKAYHYYIPDSLESVTITDAKTINTASFYNCDNLTSIKLNEGITSIDSYAFVNCGGLKEIQLPSSLTTIGINCFQCCGNLETINLHNNIKEIGSGVFKSCSSLLNVSMPESLTYIPDYMFSNCDSLTSFEIPDTITIIGKNSFADCSNLETIKFSESLETIDSYAFSECQKLRDLYFPSSLKYINSFAFQNCKNITELVVPDNISLIGEGAFKGMWSLVKLTIPFVGASREATGFEAVFGYVFGYNKKTSDVEKKGTGYIYISSNSCIYSCYTGKSYIDYYDDVEHYYIDIYNYSVPNSINNVTITDASKIETAAFISCRSLNEININEGIATIEARAFQNCAGLKKINIPKSVTTIKNHVFAECESIEKIKFPDSLKIIGYNAFDGCSSLKELNFPASLQGIGNFAFQNCTSITELVVPDNVTSIGEGAFKGMTLLHKITLPFVGSSRTAESHKAVLGYVFGYTWRSKYTIDSANGFVNSKIYDDDKLTWQYTQYDGTIKKIDNVWQYLMYSYYYYIPDSLTDVTISDATKIETAAFNECKNLTNVSLNDEITSIGSYAFQNCIGLTEFNVPKEVTSIEEHAFNSCSNLTDINFNDRTSSIGSYGFYNCTSLTKIDVPETVTSIGAYAFYDCKNLLEVNLNCKISLIESGVFQCCYKLNKIIIPETVTSIESAAFNNCTELTKINIPENVISIGRLAFNNCPKIKELHISNNLKEAGDEAFKNNNLTVFGHSGSYIESYCKNNRISFIAYEDVDSIKITKNALSSQYLGKPIDTTGMEITAVLKDGTEIIVNDNISVSPEIITESGEQTVIVTFGNSNTTFTVNAKGINGIAVLSLPTKTDYVVGDTFDSTGLEIKVYYSDGTTEVINEGFTVNVKILEPVGDKLITIAYHGKTANFKVSVVDVQATGLEIETMPIKTEYVVGDEVSTTGLVIKATYNNGKTASIMGGFTVLTAIDSVDVTEVVIEHAGKTISYPITVSPLEPIGWSLATEPQKLDYLIGESLDKTGLTLTEYFNNGSVATVTEGFTCTPETFTEVGEQIITVSYKNNTAMFVVYIHENGSWSYAGNNVFEWICGTCGEVVESKTVNLTFNAESIEVYNRETFSLVATATDNFDCEILFDSSDDSIASVDENGVVTANSAGKATITATIKDTDITATCEVSVLSRTFTVKWIVDGDITEDTVNVGDEITTPEDPKKAGYIFNGWTPAIPEEMPAEDLTFTATFIANSYDATFDANGGLWSDGATKKLVSTEYGTVIIAPEAPEREGYLFSCWAPEVGIMDDVNGKTYSAVWVASTDTIYTVETYTMNTEGEYSKSVQTLNGTTNEVVTVDPSVETGFVLNAEKSVLEGVVSADSSLVLKVYIDRNIYFITTIAGGEETKTSLYYGCAIPMLDVSEKTGYTFSGWTPEVPAVMPATDLIFTALFTPNSYDASFDANGGVWTDGETLKTVSSQFDSKIATPEAPQKQGYVFAGWTPEVDIMDDVNGKNFVAKWKAAENTPYVVETYTMNNSGEYEKVVQNCVGITEETASVKLEITDGFALDTEKSILSGKVVADGSLVLKVYINRNSYSLTTIAGDSSTQTTYLFGSVITEPDEPVKEGYQFVSWSEEFPETMPANNVVISAIWNANSYNAVFDTNEGAWSDGSSKKTFSVKYDSEIIAPERPVRQGYIFSGWMLDSENLGTNLGIMDNVNGKIFTACWIPSTDTTYTVETFTMNTEGEYVKSVQTLSGTTNEVVKVTPSIAKGFALNEEKSVVEGTISADNSLVLKVYIDRKNYIITTVADDNITEIMGLYGSVIPTIVTPEKTGYTFVGWDNTVPSVMPAENVTLTAIFSVNKYNATFKANGGVWADGTVEKLVSIEYGALVIAPEIPSREGYSFMGWSPELGTMDDVNGKTFTAVWNASTDTVYTVETYTMNTSGEYEKSSQTYNGTTGEAITAEYTVPSGFSFNAEKSVTGGIVAADDSLVLKVFLDRNTYILTTVVDGISTPTAYLYGSMVSKPVTPSKTDYKFMKWDGIIPETMPAENVTITAVFEKCYVCPDCGKEILGEVAINDHIVAETKVTISSGVTVTSGELKPGATITVSAPQIDGKIFSRWIVDGATISDADSSETTIVLGSGKISITAEYEDCSCKCHQGGIAGFFFKIVLFFQKLFGNNLECFCGKKH